MKAYVVGSHGYIGKEIISKCADVISAYGLTTRPEHNDEIYFRLERPDDFDYSIVNPGDVVILTAGQSSPDKCAEEFDASWNINVHGTSRFLGRILDMGGRAIFFSTDAVYGESADLVDSNDSCFPLGAYAEMKYEVEQRFVSSTAFKVLRLSYVFSAEDKFTSYLWACSRSCTKAEIYHPFCRAVVFRNDVVDAVLMMVQGWESLDSQIFNAAGPELLSRIDFCEALKISVCSDLEYTVVDPPRGFFENRAKAINVKSDLPKLLGRQPTSLTAAIQKEFQMKRL